AFNAVIILAALLFVAGPMAAIVVAGLKADLARLVADPAVHAATTTSIVLAFLSALLSVTLSVSLVMARRAMELRRPRMAPPSLLERLLDTGAGFVLVVPPLVIGAGWFVLMRGSGHLFAIAPVMVAT